MATKQPYVGHGSWHPWPHCKAFDPRESLNLSQHVCTNVSSFFAVSIPRNENDFVGVIPLSVNGICVNMVLRSWTESFVSVIPGNDLAFGESRFSWILHYRDPRHYHLSFLGGPNSVTGTYFFPPFRNLSPTCVTARSLGLFPHAGHTPWHPILFGVFDMTLP